MTFDTNCCPVPSKYFSRYCYLQPRCRREGLVEELVIDIFVFALMEAVGFLMMDVIVDIVMPCISMLIAIASSVSVSIYHKTCQTMFRSRQKNPIFEQHLSVVVASIERLLSQGKPIANENKIDISCTVEDHSVVKATVGKFIYFKYNMVTGALCAFELLSEFGGILPFMSADQDPVTQSNNVSKLASLSSFIRNVKIDASSNQLQLTTSKSEFVQFISRLMIETHTARETHT